MKPALVSLGCMAMLASATPILSDPASTQPAKGDRTLDRPAMLAPDSRDTASGNMLGKRDRRNLNVPNHIGTAVQNIGVIVVKAIVDAAGELLFRITNNSPYPYQVSLREVGMGLDAATLNVAGRHTIDYEPLGGINPGDRITIYTQNKG
ncbi:hypothetical protein FOQG_17915 [Fusarium oxysporum f. sp. raphani 54005]|uniref:Uncharacterized protein n=2 Tax=Fusarium oxysporum f. sp. raphani TaxID=96318 RepID=X0BFW4_FUSOX|nr:hypothetical protein FOQG_17915 [Fusarium oxysporum f. sp. raphani 54005]KAG7407986.1 hypothetical protein Forpi1262_v018084 [Fusarium oxysporum f. sp. raphani]